MSESTTRKAIVDEARKHLGVREVGINHGRAVARFLASVGLSPGYAWCAAFVYFVLKACGLGHLGPRTGKAAVRNWERWAEKTGRIITLEEAQPGDLFFWLNENGTGHIGFYLGKGPIAKSFVTIEGNTNQAGSREGDGVYSRTRTLRSNIRFIRIWKAA